jgi:50S ribosomal protein L16 3-hydroxylase
VDADRARGRAVTTLLGGLAPARFLAKHWQKEPLLVRQAIPGFTGFPGMRTPRDLAKLARTENAVARTVRHAKKHWRLAEGPFHNIDVDKVPREWTLLVQGVEQHVDGAWDLLRQFDFIPTARVDDLMVSWATPGGSVGPHFDAYDVFLLQGSGKRRWSITRTLDTEEARACLDAEDVRVLARFEPVQEWTLEAGDMLYLPPNVGHWGVAVDAAADKGAAPCMTFSIGFLAPSHEQLLHNFLAFLGQEAGAPEGVYADPDLKLQRAPAELVDATVARVEGVLAQLTWDRERVATFLGRLLTGPKPSVVFTPPKRPLAARAFANAVASPRGTLKLAGPSRMLFRDGRFFLNGEALAPSHARTVAALRTLANTRALALPLDVDDEGLALLHDGYLAGFLVLS